MSFVFKDSQCTQAYDHDPKSATLSDMCGDVYGKHGSGECMPIKVDCDKSTICMSNQGCHQCSNSDQRVQDCVQESQKKSVAMTHAVSAALEAPSSSS